MALQGSGQMKMSDIYDEFTGTHNGSQEIQMSDYRDKGDVPAGSGTEIQLATDMYGASNISYTSATGGTITTYTSSGVNYKVHSFTSSGTFAVSSVGSDATINCLVVAGGGGAASSYDRNGGGGGAGGMEYYDNTVTSDSTTVGGVPYWYNGTKSFGRGQSKTITAQNYTIYVGSGGSGGGSTSTRKAGNGGTGSYIRLADGSTYMVICRGGGGGHGDNYTGSDGGSFGGRGGQAGSSNATAGDGGSGGGGYHGSWSGSPRGAAHYYNNSLNENNTGDGSNNRFPHNTFTSTTSIEDGRAGNGGGTGVNSTGMSFAGGGGGGAGSGGTGGGYRSNGAGRGGAARSNTIRTGSAVYYATGGASGAGYVISGASVQGANRPSGEYVAADYEDHVFTGNANTGDAGDNNGTGYAGGSGIVVIRYVVE